MKEMLNEKPKMHISVKEGVIQEFERKYKETCNQQHMRKKNRGVSSDSPFYAGNIPPREYLEFDYKLPDKPNKMSPQSIDMSKVKATGKLSEVGKKILEVGTKNAPYITTMNWGHASSLNISFEEQQKKKEKKNNCSTQENSPERLAHLLEIRKQYFSIEKGKIDGQNNHVRFIQSQLNLQSDSPTKQSNKVTIQTLEQDKNRNDQQNNKSRISPFIGRQKLLINDQQYNSEQQRQLNETNQEFLSKVKEMRRIRNEARLFKKMQQMTEEKQIVSERYNEQRSSIAPFEESHFEKSKKIRQLEMIFQKQKKDKSARVNLLPALIHEGNGIKSYHKQ